MAEVLTRLEVHLWFKNFDQYAARERELLELLGETHGDGSVIVFFRATPEYLEIQGASYDPLDKGHIDRLMDFCGRDNIDFVARVSRDTDRKLGYLRGKQKQNE